MGKDIGYVVPHTHWDREWRYPLWQNRILLTRFIEELLQILDTNPEYKCFVLDGQSVIIEDYLEVRPKDTERVCKYIKEGRLAIGPWYTLPDLYPIDGECLVRNLLKGIRYSDSLGGHLKVGYNSFGWGQTAQFPQIYQGFGIDVIIAAKNIKKSRAPESEFLWEAPDGTRVLTTRLGKGVRNNFYVNAYVPIMNDISLSSYDSYRVTSENAGTLYHRADEQGLYKDCFKLLNTAEIHENQIKDTSDAVWGNTNETTVKTDRLFLTGCDFSGPLPKITEIIKKINELYTDREFKSATLVEYTNKLKERVDYSSLKIVNGELRDGSPHMCSANALQTRSYIKRLNKKVQNNILHFTEPVSVMSMMVGGEYDKEFINLAIKYMLLSQAHDSINGVTQDKTAEDVVNRLNQALEISEVTGDYSCGEIIKRIDTSIYDKGDVLLVAINPTAMPRNEIVRVWLNLPREWNVLDFDIVDCDGNIAKTQFLSRQEAILLTHEFDCRPWPLYSDRYSFLMDTGEIPSGGYKTYKLKPKNKMDRNTICSYMDIYSSGQEISKHSCLMENEYLKVKVNQNGTIDIFNKSTGQNHENLNYYEDTGDSGDYWIYYPPYSNKTFTSLGCQARIWTEENGSLSATIAAEVKMKLPAYAIHPEFGIKGESKRADEEKELTATAYYTLKKGSKRVDVRLKVDNTVEDHRFRVLFDTGIKVEKSCAAGHFTVDKRPVCPQPDRDNEYFTHMQTVPQQGFVDISDGKTGIAFINNCLSEFETIDNDTGTLALTLFRSVRNMICTTGPSYNIFPEQKGGQSLGMQEYEYSIYPHRGYWDEAFVYKETTCFNVPLRLVQTSCHSGVLPLKQEFISVEPENLVVSAIKKAEDRESIVIRLFNPTDDALKGRIKVYSSIKEAFLTNLNEERQQSLNIIGDNEISVEAGSNKIVTVELVHDM